MANVMFKKGLQAALPSTYSEGTFYITTDERAIYLDVSNDARIRIGDIQEFETLTQLQANQNPSTSALYYVRELNCLAKWNGAEYIQINLDTGATSVEIAGEGNAVTNITYDAATRKLVVTKGATYATPGDVNSKVGELVHNGTTYTTVAEFVNAKTAGIATDAALGDLQNRVADAETDIDNLQAEVEALPGKYDAKGAAAAVQTALNEEISRAQGAEGANATAAANAQSAADAAQDAVDTLSGKVGEVPADKTVVQMIDDARIAATYDDTAVKKDVADNKAAIALLNDGASVSGSIDYKIAQAVAAIMENPDETMNSINELVTWCNDHAADALELSNKVSANETDIAALEGLVGTTAVATQITDAIVAALKIDGVDKYALAADLTAAIARIVALEAKSHNHDNASVINGITAEKVSAWDAAEQNAKNYADGLATNYDASGSAVNAEKNAKAYADSLATNYDAAGAATTAENNAKAYADSLVLTWGSF